MNAVRDRAEARWLPSRFRYAIFRLIALMMISRAKPKEARGLVLVIDRDQSAPEYYIISTWLLVTASCYVGALLSPLTTRAIAALAAVPVAAMVIKFPLYLGGLTAIGLRALGSRVEDMRSTNSKLTYGMLMLASLWFIRNESWIRYVAVAFFVVLAVNALASIVVVLLRGRIAAVDRAYGVVA